MFIMAQIFGVSVVISNVLSMQMKKKKQIIFMLILANLFSAINFILLQSYSGALICFFAMMQTFINNFFEKKGKSIPILLIGIYIIISILCGLITYQNYIDILPIISSILYTIMIIQKREKNIRRITLINMILWVIYDLVAMAYMMVVSDIITIGSTIIGMYRYDYRMDKNKEEVLET